MRTMTYGYVQGVKQMSKELTTNCWSASTVINITALNASKLRIKNMANKPQIHWLCPLCDTVMTNLKNEKSCKKRCQKFLKKVEERIIELEKEIRTEVDETRVSEMIKEAKL